MSQSQRKERVKERLRQRLEQVQQPQIVSRTPRPDEVQIGEAGRGLFSPNNPLKKMAEEIFSPSDMKEYKKQGEYMYGIDYDKINIDNSGNDENTQFILIALKSGLKISSLDEDELAYMEAIHGKNWIQKLGITED